MRRRWSLRTRLVVSAVALIAVVVAVIGTVTTIAMHSNLERQLDKQLVAAAQRPDHDPMGGDRSIVQQPGLPIGTVGGRTAVGGDGLVDGVKSVATPGARPDSSPLGDDQLGALESVPRDGYPHTVSLPGLGDFRAISSSSGTFVLGFPLTGVQSTVTTLIVVEVCVTAAGLLAAAITGTALVGVALRPLRRVAATATRVSELPLHSGEVAPLERVPDAEADPRTEVGQVGAALNRMLGHVGSALAARQESETRVRQFVADASHELRTPLASIRGYAELTRRGGEETGPDTRHALGRIESEARRMTGLVEDLLLLARLDAGRPLTYQSTDLSPLTYESTDLSPLVVDAVSDARAAGQDHTWRLELPDDPALVPADGARIQQVLVNLLANARTHTPPGTTVTARVRRDGGWVVVEVLDDGPGIPAELLPYVFERFARGDASRSRHAGSTGLGLAIVQAVVVGHGGTVTVRSAPGRTEFVVRLPGVAAVAGHPGPSGVLGHPGDPAVPVVPTAPAAPTARPTPHPPTHSSTTG
ncbi:MULTISPECIES: HAMP domain-containing sensor histidine kinase [unclassified Streptomyces]|uniref:HAMP domain-containing sensor histidine kinase n=1 Tax=unclassified Streptomyces TaxID=2593676 RepID=UPI002E0F2080|nr:HAMP domain-containing histidine kinase [Streptomyces sp. NBC_01197]WSS53613.1 HAMP domain-containing histidine kinase [Streptomyces sp. NBC_01180]